MCVPLFLSNPKRKIGMLNFNLVSDIKALTRNMKELKQSRRLLKQSRERLEQDALERQIKHANKMFDIEREHELRMQMYDEQAAVQEQLQQSKMKVFNDAEAARESLSQEIDVVLLKLHDKNVEDKEAVLLELMSLNNEMHDITMAALKY